MKTFQLLVCIVLLLSCSEKKKESLISLSGNWYTNLEGVGNPFDVSDTVQYSSNHSAGIYCEYYLNDSTMTYCEGTSMLGYDLKYFVRNDSIYQCVRPDLNCEFIPMYKIESLNSDTLRLIVHSKYSGKRTNIFWVRLPQGELGTYDHSWVDTARFDSLISRTYGDFSRRRTQFLSRK